MRSARIVIARLDERGRQEVITIDASPDAAVFYSPRWQKIAISGPKVSISYERVISVNVGSEESLSE